MGEHDAESTSAARPAVSDSEAELISLVIPIYNEEDCVDELYRRIRAVLGVASSWELIFVDDGSTDGSLEKLKQIASQDSRVRAVELGRNYGQTASLSAGIDCARGGVVVTMDGDLQHQPEEIPKLLAKLAEGYDIVSGFRESRQDNYFLRRLPSRIANWMARQASGVRVQDFGSTFKAYRANILKRIDLFGELHRFIPILASRMGARIVEIPIAVQPRTSGESKYGLSRTFGVFQDIIFLEFYAKYLTKPMRAFGKIFLLCFGVGFALSAGLMLLWATGQIVAVWHHPALLLLSVFLMMVGIHFLVLGVLAELLTRIYLTSRESKIYWIRAIHEQPQSATTPRG